MASVGVEVRDTARLRQLIMSHGYTHTDFARQMKITKTHMSRVLHGTSRCGVALAFKMSVALDTEFQDLFRLEEK